jgi:hypothetical protein
MLKELIGIIEGVKDSELLKDQRSDYNISPSGCYMVITG